MMTICISFISIKKSIIKLGQLTKLLMLFKSASVNNIHDIFLSHLSENFPASFLAVEEYLTSVICANYYDAEIWGVKMDVDVE